MTRKLDRPRRVLASLVPVDARADPLDHATLPRTDFDFSSALRVAQKSQRHVPESHDGLRASNQHEDERRRLDAQLEEAKRAWTQQQERCFDAQIALTSLSKGPPPGVQQAQPSLIVSPAPLPSLELRLRGVEALIRGAGNALGETEASLGSARELYAKAADQLAETLRALQTKPER